MNIKECCECHKRFVLEKGFYKVKTNKDGYSLFCKTCHLTKVKDDYHEKMQGNHKTHKFSPYRDLFDKCERCELLRKRIPHQFKIGTYIYLYFVDNQWINKRPVKCN